MKKVKFDGKLSLNKETIAKLNDEQMKSINGGKPNSYDWNCPISPTVTICHTMCNTCQC